MHAPLAARREDRHDILVVQVSGRLRFVLVDGQLAFQANVTALGAAVVTQQVAEPRS
jgi:hypothetical protein